MLTSAQTATLRTELTADPRGYGYAAPYGVGNDQAVADLLNLTRPTVTVREPQVSSKAVWEAINVADMAALPANPTNAQLSNERRQLAWLSGLPNIPLIRLLNDDGTDTPVVANLRAAFAAGSGTLTRLVALATRPGSRAEELFGATTVVTRDDVSGTR